MTRKAFLIALLWTVALIALSIYAGTGQAEEMPKSDLHFEIYTADWCGPCKTAKAIVERFAAEIDADVKVINTDKQPASIKAMRITMLPTIIVRNNDGKEIGRVVGKYPKEQFTKKVKSFFPQSR